MKFKVAQIGILLKKIYRRYSHDLLAKLRDRGFTDLRISFLEVLNFISHNDGATIKEIGLACGLKKQTMTGHLNELVKRNYIRREQGKIDKREQNIFLTEYGHEFQLALFESLTELDSEYTFLLGEVELERMLDLLQRSFAKLSPHSVLEGEMELEE